MCVEINTKYKFINNSRFVTFVLWIMYDFSYLHDKRGYDNNENYLRGCI